MSADDQDKIVELHPEDLSEAELAELARLKLKDPIRFAREVRIHAKRLDVPIKAIEDHIKVRNEREEANLEKADELIEIGKTRAQLWHDNDDKSYATFSRDGHLEHHALDADGFQYFLTDEYGKDHQTSIGGELNPTFPRRPDLNEATYHLHNYARRDQLHNPRIRIWPHGEDWTGELWLDLGRPDWKGVRITAEGWKIENQIPAKMVRNVGMKALPLPVSGGNIQDLRQFVHVRDDADFVLFCGTTAALLNVFGDYTTTIFCGPAGSGKTTATNVMRVSVDPNTVATRSLTTVRNLQIGAGNTHIIAFDNISDITAAESDVICSLNTGTSFAERQLYTNNKEFRSILHCPVLLNGIPGNLAEREDLADRVVTFEFDLLGDELISKDTFWRRFNTHYGAFLGLFLDGAVAALRVRRDFNDDADEAASTVLGKYRPRFIDYVLWGECSCRQVGFEDGAFTQAYRDNKDFHLRYLAKHNAVCIGIKGLIDELGKWQGTPEALVNAIRPHVRAHDPLMRVPNSVWLMRDGLPRAIPLLMKVHRIIVRKGIRLQQDDNRNGIEIEQG